MHYSTRSKTIGVGRIYGLYDPDTGELRYIGKTCHTPAVRLKGHLRNAERGARTHLCNWLRSLDRPPHYKVLKTTTLEALNAAEVSMIRWHRSRGTALTNTTDGGDGGATTRGRVWSQEDRERHSRRLIGIPHRGVAENNRRNPPIKKGTFKHSEETKRKIAATKIGRPRPDLVGKAASQETRRKIQQATKQQWQTKREAMLAALNNATTHAKHSETAKEMWRKRKEERA